MATQSDVSSRIVATLAITEPDLDTAVGSVTRKIIDAVAQQVADTYVDQHLLTYQYDIDSKIEADLDDFVQLFGISRIAAKRATGVLVFQRGTGDTTLSVSIPVNTQVASSLSGNGGQATIVQTVTPGFMGIGVSTVEVPVQAVQPGLAGNVGAGLLTRFRTPVPGILGVTNVQPLSGGVGQETDSELRARWKRTVFRSLAGTEAMYLGIALNHTDCFGANVLGATKTQTEQIQIQLPPAGSPSTVWGVGISELDDVLYAYPETAVMGAHLAGSQVLLRGHDFEIDTSVRPPKITMLISEYATGRILESGAKEKLSVVGSVFDLTYEYAPKDSRNLPGEGITNRVDVWCAGVKAVTATQSVIFSAGKRFVPDYGSPYWVYNFVRQNNSAPAINNVFIPLAFGPIIELPTTLSVAGTTYKLNEDYWLVHDDTAFGYTATSRFGIEWSANRIPTSPNPVFIVGENEDYVYNQMIEDIQGGIERWRMTGIDAQAHAAKLQYLRFNIAVMYDRGATPEIVNGLIENALQNYLHGLTFGSTVQASDVLQAIHSVAGIDNVRFLDKRDWLTYTPANANAFGVGIQRVVRDSSGDATVVESYVDPATGEPLDITFGDAEVPVYESFRGDRLIGSTGQAPSGIPAVRAQNTFWKGVNSPALADGSTPPPPPPSGAPANDITLTGSATDQGGSTYLVLNWTDPGPSSLGFGVFRDDGTVPVYSTGPANGTPRSTSFGGSAVGGTHSYVVKGYSSYDVRGADYAIYDKVSNSLSLTPAVASSPTNLRVENAVYGANPSGSGPMGWMVTYLWDGGAAGGDFVHDQEFYSDGQGSSGVSYNSAGQNAPVLSGYRAFVPDISPTASVYLNFYLNNNMTPVSPNMTLMR